MREIPLTQGLVAIVDDDDYESLSAYKWHARILGTSRYAGRKVRTGKTFICVHMHRAILPAPIGMDVDHINGDGLDNRRCNLRIATRAQNLQNRGAPKDNKSGYKGVCWHRKTRRWMAQITTAGKHRYLGVFCSPDEAHAVYCAAAKEQHGEFARFA
jgi:hypothetical protein